MDKLYNIKLANGTKYLAEADDELSLKINDECVVRNEYFLDYGTIIDVMRITTEIKEFIPKIERKATIRDKSKANENNMRAKSALKTGTQYANNLKLGMKMLNCLYSFDCKSALFQFTSDGRVDFRELVKQLAQSLNTRIELRQIGVRDEAAIQGGIGICGQEFCCSRYLKNFDSINVKMAKEQDFSLNPATISGCCGRLKCCLKFEHEGYKELDKGMPRYGDCCECECGRGNVVDRNLLTQKVTVNVNGQRKEYDKDEIRVVYPDKYNVSKNNKGNNKNQGQKQGNQQNNKNNRNNRNNRNKK